GNGAIPDYVAVDHLLIRAPIHVNAYPHSRRVRAVNEVPADQVFPAHDPEVDAPAIVQPLHDVVDAVVDDSVLARVREPLNALRRQWVVADLLPAELEAAPLLAAEFPEVIDRAVREHDPPVGHVVDVIEGDEVLSALGPGDGAGVPEERPA